MKRGYSKPTVYVEELQLDTPIAANCIANRQDILDLMKWGYFTYERNCVKNEVTNPLPSGTTICYHTNIETAFLS